MVRNMEQILDYGRGYSGKMGNKCWVARIDGTDETYELDRDFLDPESVEKDHFNRYRTMVHFHYNLPVGIYEESEGGSRDFFIVWVKNGEEVRTIIDKERVLAILSLIDEGMEFETARLKTKPV